MQNPQPISEIVAGILSDHNQQESTFYSYILTPEEEKSVIRHEIEQRMKAAIRKMQGLGYLQQQIEAKLATMDFRSEIDEFNLLDRANVRKHYQIDRQKADQEYFEHERNLAKNIAKACDARYFFRLLVKSFEFEDKQLIQDEHSNPYIKALCFFMSKDDRLETELGMSPNKGLWVYGQAGLGKTRFIEGVRDNDRWPVEVISMLTVADMVREHGDFKVSFGEQKKFLFDDVGSEEHQINHYGTKKNWFKDTIELYYARRSDFSKLMVTTNDDFDAIEEKYGYRVRSRIREMFNVIEVTGEDRRK